MKKQYNYWTDDSLAEFKNAWQFKTKDEIMLLYPNHTYNQLRAIAGYYHIVKKISPRHKKLSRLLEWSPESCYWLGFLMGDGSFYKGCIDLTLATKDVNHLEKYISFNNLDISPKLKNKGKYESYRVQIEDIDTISQIHKIFDFESPKTYNPYNLSYILSHEYFIPFFAGYIDADGNIRRNNHGSPQIRIISHINWKNNLELIANKLLEFDIDSKIYTKKYTTLYIQRQKSILNLYKEISNFRLPLLERKWNILK